MITIGRKIIFRPRSVLKKNGFLSFNVKHRRIVSVRWCFDRYLCSIKFLTRLTALIWDFFLLLTLWSLIMENVAKCWFYTVFIWTIFVDDSDWRSCFDCNRWQKWFFPVGETVRIYASRMVTKIKSTGTRWHLNIYESHLSSEIQIKINAKQIMKNRLAVSQ